MSVASVSSRTLATETAFSKPTAHDFGWIDLSRLLFRRCSMLADRFERLFNIVRR